MVSHEALIILQWATRKTHPRAYQCIWDNYIIFARKILLFLCFVNIGCLCVSKNAVVSKDEFFYLLSYNMICWFSHIYKKSYFLSFSILLFLVNNTGEVVEQNWQSATRVNGMKNATMQVTYSLNSPVVNLLHYCHIILNWEFVTFSDKFSHNFTLEVQIVGKISEFECYWRKYRNAAKQLSFQKFENILQGPTSRGPP